MKIGCCLNMLGTAADPLGLQWLETADSLGYDYVELALAQIMDLTDSEFDELLHRLGNLRINCECCNNFFPASLRLTGDRVSMGETVKYLDRAFQRVSRLGAEVIVFGSSGAKNVPEGFSHEAAFEQLVGLLKTVSVYCEKHSVKIAIEPLNRKESNIILNLADGMKLAEAVNLPRIKLLVDYYHHCAEEEPDELVAQAGKHLIHAHFARPDGRGMPLEREKGYKEFFDTLRSVGYSGRISVEAYSQNPKAELAEALRVLRELD